MRTRLSVPLRIALAGCCATFCLAAGIGQNSLDSLLESGVKLAQQERYTEAVQVFEKCVQQDAESFEAHYNLALALFALQRFSEARGAIENVRASGEAEQLATQYLLGKLDEALGRLPQARRELSAAFEGAPHEENYALDLGLLMIQQNDYENARGVFARAARAHPQSAYVLLGLAMAQAFGGKPEEATTTCTRILQADPTFTPAMLLMAYSHYMAGDYEETERIAAAGLHSLSASPYLYYLHAATLLKLNSTDYTRMLQELEIAERGIPSCTLCYFARSKVHQASGDTPAAITDLEALVKHVSPDFEQAWYRLAALYERAGRQQDSERARARFEAIKSTAVDRDTELIRNMIIPNSRR